MVMLQNSPGHWRLPPLPADTHKYKRGHVLLLGGATMTGAAKLAALAAQRAGAGVVTIAAPPASWPVYASSMMSVITRKLTKEAGFDWILKNRKVSAVLLGPGNDPLELRTPLLAAIRSGLPLVLDAGALELLAKGPALRARLRGRTFICLPHEGEYRKLAEALDLDAQAAKPLRALALAQALGGIVLLKGAETIIAAPDGRMMRHETHAPWLASGGTGDVLAGIAAALASQAMEPFDATCAAAWLHSEAAQAFGPGMVAEDLLGALPQVLRNLS